MPRKGPTQKRDVLADPVYNNKVVTKHDVVDQLGNNLIVVYRISQNIPVLSMSFTWHVNFPP